MGCEIRENIDLYRFTTFKIGGLCDKLYIPDTSEDFIDILQTLKNPLIIGGGSNLLISANGVNCPVISTTKLKSFSINGSIINTECGVFGAMLAQSAAKANLSGFEFLVSFPGTVGGNLYMNASAHGQFMSDCFVSAQIFDKKSNTIKTLLKKDMDFDYKKSVLQNGNYFLIDAKFELKQADASAIKNLMIRNLAYRKVSQPSLSYPNAGCAFKNPKNDSAGRLLDKAGFKGYEEENVKIWHNHANFIINKGNASSTDVLELMLKMYNKVKETYNIELVPEIIYAGRKSEREEEICNIIYQKTQK